MSKQSNDLPNTFTDFQHGVHQHFQGKKERIMKTTLAALMLTAGLFADSASAADPHLDDLAFTLKQQAALACREVRYGFQRTPAFPHLYKDFYELYTLADHIHDVAHNHGDLCRLKESVDQMDALFHHAQELTARSGNVRVVQTGGGFHYVPACGSAVSSHHLRRLQVIMAQMEETIHHLQDDLEALLSPRGVVPPVPPSQLGPAFPSVPQAPVYAPQSGFPSPGVPYRGAGYRGRNGKVAFSIQIGR
jgi:hypothetical protein